MADEINTVTAQRDRAARCRLVEGHLGMVMAMAKSFKIDYYRKHYNALHPESLIWPPELKSMVCNLFQVKKRQIVSLGL